MTRQTTGNIVDGNEVFSSLGNAITKYLPLIITILTVAMMWASQAGDITTLKAFAAETEVQQMSEGELLTEIQVKIGQIETNSTNIFDTLTEIKADIKEIRNN
jgi:hypothetical protein